MSEIEGIQRATSLKTSHFADPERNYEASPVRKRVHPHYFNVHRIQGQYIGLKERETKKSQRLC
jgi:hypothetical protein